jgi:hypothetical protein
MDLSKEERELVIKYLRGYIIKDGLNRNEKHKEIEKEVHDFIERVNEVFGSDVYEDFIKLRKEKLYGAK